MDAKTIQYYDDNAKSVFELYTSQKTGFDKYWKLAFPPGSTILDIGSGSGRDLSLMIQENYNAYGTEPSRNLRTLAVSKTPRLNGRIYSCALPDLSEQIERSFDGVLCSAVFQHLPQERQFDAAFDIRKLLKPNGRLLLSFPNHRPGIDDSDRDSYGRLFTRLYPEQIILLFERLGFRCIGNWDDEDNLGRAGITWKTLLFALNSHQIVRPIDQIEGVLNRDRKVATYKLALFRALCDIALTTWHLAVWRMHDAVGIPMQAIAERWIFYYWPLLEDDSFFIPQLRGETGDGKLSLGFREELKALIDSFRHSGGMDGFAQAMRDDKLSAFQQLLLKKTLHKLIQVIKSGPVTYAGCSSEAGKLFDYDRSSRQIIVSAGIWRELCLSGHWIRDALILRWSELTSEISKNLLSPSQIVDRLLRIPTFKRSVEEARRVYHELTDKECVWSGVTLSGKFDVDHVLHFSLWRNNDLWNLLPAAPSINREKGDRLPTNSLLKKRKDIILTYWEALHRAIPTRFANETVRFTASPILNLTKAFGVMLESVEVTALQRGCLRWEP